MLKNIIIVLIVAVIAGYAYQTMQNDDSGAADLPPLTGEVAE